LLGERPRARPVKDAIEKGRIAWQRETGYHLRSEIDLVMPRDKRLIGNIREARALPCQKAQSRHESLRPALNLETPMYNLF
jgi:hypothetical protein